DGIKGLKGKLEASDRGSAYLKALRKKEAFAKLLEDWRSFPSAQEIIAYFLSRIDSCFEAHIEPLLGIASNDEIDRAIDRHLVQPVLEEMGTGPFMLNSTHVNGMIYWLAEQCYVRWHQ
ncbi:ABC-three component system protein, partial [Qipengyuania pacifica]|uniref:ABC-three component system protein n=1 Tax=Qipengyuania pacifica TaxID=2860199 RepID=UPI001C9DB98C